MSDERWSDIHAKRWALTLPPVAPVVHAPVEQPTCAANCSGRHEVDSVICCGDCGGVAYHVVMHEWKGRDGHYFVEMRAAAGAPAYDHARRLVCCGREMVRR